ncbi:hypothetical protein N7471_005252 [Penicillium samsonianum]|uniref:uncharacterized protein n=1 Tax=Penicillium samsonianum TaxID=1882272 RepID=UPI002547625A|nr:uncharacterized protein N7471_005252 [Penicillium samsonianum]KAJ6138766.1 hypothetical protein N7471_005252 [Penicillium samsonianum]
MIIKQSVGIFNETILQTQEKRFHLGFQRIILCLYNTIGLFTINRKQVMLDLHRIRRRTSQADDRTRALVCEKRPRHIEAIVTRSRYLKLSTAYRLSLARMSYSSLYYFMSTPLKRLT